MAITPAEAAPDGKAREWRAQLDFDSNAEVGRVLGQKLLYIDGVKVRAAAAPEERTAAVSAPAAEAAGGPVAAAGGPVAAAGGPVAAAEEGEKKDKKRAKDKKDKKKD